MAFKGLFIDDTEEESIFATLLSTRGSEGLAIEYRPVSEAAILAGEIFETNPDIIALDFRLDENPEMIAPKLAYKGSGLAQLLRDKASVQPLQDFPIVLISAEEKFEQFYRPDSTAHDLFDRTYGKVYASENSSQVKSELLALCSGYRLLKSIWTADRLSVFGLDGAEREVVESQELRTMAQVAAPHIMARVILRNIIDRPGILLSDAEIAAKLGLSEIGPLEEKLVANNLMYDGIFHQGWRRWWAHRFADWATDLFGQRPVNMLGSERRALLEAKFNLTLSPAESTWNRSQDERFAFACAACDRPGEIRHSVAAFDPSAPRYTQRRRICWDCIQTGRYEQARLAVDDVDANIAKDVLNMPRDEDGAD